MPKSSSSNVSSQIAHTQKIRRKQIEKLKQYKLNVTMIHRDVQYKVDFILKNENEQYAYSIVIDLPPGFPSEAPMLFVHPPCSHKYLDAAQVVTNFPPLDGFKNKPELATVVKRLINEFEKKPPVPLVVSPSPYQGSVMDNTIQSHVSQYPNLNELQLTSTADDENVISPVNNGPKLPATLPELEDLSVEELKELNEDDIQLLGLFNGSEMAKNMRDEREEISKRIEKVANDNLYQSEHLEKCRENLVKNFDKCFELKEKYEMNVKRLVESSEWMSLNNLSLTIQVSAAEQEEKSEKMVEQFLNGEMNVNEFTKEFVKTKSLAVTRKVQEDKIKHILASQ